MRAEFLQVLGTGTLGLFGFSVVSIFLLLLAEIFLVVDEYGDGNVHLKWPSKESFFHDPKFEFDFPIIVVGMFATVVGYSLFILGLEQAVIPLGQRVSEKLMAKLKQISVGGVEDVTRCTSRSLEETGGGIRGNDGMYWKVFSFSSCIGLIFTWTSPDIGILLRTRKGNSLNWDTLATLLSVGIGIGLVFFLVILRALNDGKNRDSKDIGNGDGDTTDTKSNIRLSSMNHLEASTGFNWSTILAALGVCAIVPCLILDDDTAGFVFDIGVAFCGTIITPLVMTIGCGNSELPSSSIVVGNVFAFPLTGSFVAGIIHLGNEYFSRTRRRLGESEVTNDVYEIFEQACGSYLPLICFLLFVVKMVGLEGQNSVSNPKDLERDHHDSTVVETQQSESSQPHNTNEVDLTKSTGTDSSRARPWGPLELAVTFFGFITFLFGLRFGLSPLSQGISHRFRTLVMDSMEFSESGQHHGLISLCLFVFLTTFILQILEPGVNIFSKQLGVVLKFKLNVESSATDDKSTLDAIKRNDDSALGATRQNNNSILGERVREDIPTGTTVRARGNTDITYSARKCVFIASAGMAISSTVATILSTVYNISHIDYVLVPLLVLGIIFTLFLRQDQTLVGAAWDGGGATIGPMSMPILIFLAEGLHVEIKDSTTSSAPATTGESKDNFGVLQEIGSLQSEIATLQKQDNATLDVLTASGIASCGAMGAVVSLFIWFSFMKHSRRMAGCSSNKWIYILFLFLIISIFTTLLSKIVAMQSEMGIGIVFGNHVDDRFLDTSTSDFSDHAEVGKQGT